MVCLGLKPEVAEWKAQTNPLSYGGTPRLALEVGKIDRTARLDFCILLAVTSFKRVN